MAEKCLLMAERNPTMMYRNIHVHGGTKTPKVCKHCWRTLSFEAVAAKAAKFTSSGEGTLLGSRRLTTSPATPLLVGWEEELLVGARHL